MQHLWTFLKGLLMGAADIIPGVSGGTIAFITGIYDRFITGLSNIGDALKLWSRGKWKQGWEKIDFALFIPLGLGIIVAFYLGSFFIPTLLENHPTEVFSFFIGLILASAYFVYSHITRHTGTSVLFGILGVIFGFAIAAYDGIAASPSVFTVFFLGMIAICAMLLPGISGSYILLMFGQYEYILHALKDLDIVVISAFIVGAAIGLLAFSRILSSLLKKYHNIMFSLLTGIMVGALYRPGNVALTNMDGFVIPLILLILGAALVFVIQFVSERKS